MNDSSILAQAQDVDMSLPLLSTPVKANNQIEEEKVPLIGNRYEIYQEDGVAVTTPAPFTLDASSNDDKALKESSPDECKTLTRTPKGSSKLPDLPPKNAISLRAKLKWLRLVRTSRLGYIRMYYPNADYFEEYYFNAE